LLYGGSSTASTFFGLSEADKLFMFADGANNTGFGLGTLQAQPLVLGTNNTARVTISGTGQTKVNYAFALAYHGYTGTHAIDETDGIVDCTSGSFTITLPTAVGCAGRLYVLKNSGSSTTITIATTSSQTIDGSAPGTITTLVPTKIFSDGANWKTW
jgi:hypothetical protein